MTACVVIVLLTPQTMPDAITSTMSAGLFSTQIAMPSVKKPPLDQTVH